MTTQKSIKAAAKKAGITVTIDEALVATATTTENVFIQTDASDVEGEEGEPAAVDILSFALDQAKLAVAALLNFPGVSISRSAQDDYVASKGGEELARDPDLEDLFVTLEEAANEAGDEEDEGPASVVPETYKKEYRTRSPEGTHCADWLAITLNSLIIVPVVEGKKKTMTDLDRLEDIAVVNGVDGAKLAKLRTGNNGWQGRFRMTTRNLLTPIVATKGFLFVPEGHGAKEDREEKAPAAWCLENAPKQKAEKKAKAAAIPAVAGKGKASKEAKPAKATKAPAASKGNPTAIKAPRKAKATA